MGLEYIAILAVFTGQAWNMMLTLYPMPKELEKLHASSTTTRGNPSGGWSSSIRYLACCGTPRGRNW